MSRIQIQKDYDLQKAHTFACSVKTAFYVAVRDEEALCAALVYAKKAGLPLCVLGGGSNVLFRKDFPGLVVQMALAGIHCEERGDEVWLRAGAGEVWHRLVCFAAEKGYGGIENLAYIPGSVGAAPMQNIGAYGAELKDVFHSLEAIHSHSLEKKTFYRADCRFAYRHSRFKEEDEWVTSQVTLCLQKKHTPQLSYPELKAALQHIHHPSIQDIARSVQALRTRKLPDPKKIGNAGSFFKNPLLPQVQFQAMRQAYPEMPSFSAPQGMVKVPAGWLIEQCGWKGYKEKNIGVHPEHALVLVHEGGGSGEDLWVLACRIQASVRARFGVSIEPEIRVYGA